jgi:hypothetical protein
MEGAEKLDKMVEDNDQDHQGREITGKDSQDNIPVGSEGGNEKGKEIIGDDSDDSGPYFDDILSLGGTHLSFGDFQNMEIKNIFKMQMNDRTVAVNEYGTNLVKYKYDPLAVIEAKFAMTQGCVNGENCKSAQVESELMDKVEGVVIQPTQPSSRGGVTPRVFN